MKLVAKLNTTTHYTPLEDVNLDNVKPAEDLKPIVVNTHGGKRKGAGFKKGTKRKPFTEEHKAKLAEKRRQYWERLKIEEN